MQAASRHPTFISDTTFSSLANITTIDYVNGTSILVYSSAPLHTVFGAAISRSWQRDECSQS